MILLFLFIQFLTLQRIFVDSIQTTAMLEERLEKLERKGMEQEAIIRKLVNDMEEQKIETKAQAEIIHDLYMKLEQQTEQLILKEKVISELENRLDKILDRQYSTDKKFKNMSSDNFNQSSRNKISTHKIYDDNYTTANSEKRSIRQRRLQLPVPTHPPKMNIAFRALKSLNNPGQVHGFDEVYLNLGGGFKPSSGNFVAPTSGLYLFTLSVEVPASTRNKQIIMFASVFINKISTDKIILNEPNIYQHQRSVTVIAQVNTGEIVSVESSVISIDKVVTITFSGVLISQM